MADRQSGMGKGSNAAKGELHVKFTAGDRVVQLLADANARQVAISQGVHGPGPQFGGPSFCQPFQC